MTALCVAAFVGLEVAAMRLYPGGTWWDRTTRGYRFWHNYVCDLVSNVALDGRPNLLGADLARGAMLAMALGLISLGGSCRACSGGACA